MKETKTEKNYVSACAFRNWVQAMCKQFMESDAISHFKRNCTYVYLRSKVGIAKCNSNDCFDGNIGIAYAWARCTGQPVYYEKEKYIPKEGEWVYVDTVNKTHYFKFIGEGVDNYCFKMRCGRLILIDKDKVIKIRHDE